MITRKYVSNRAVRTTTLCLGLMLLLELASAPSTGAATASRGPISIIGNSSFTSSNGVTGGSGTLNDPYIIENWIITGSSSGNTGIVIGEEVTTRSGAGGIYIENTAAYFVIRNCTVENSGDPAHNGYYNGIYLSNVKNGILSNNTCSSNNGDGIHLSSSNHNVLDNNNCSNNINFNGISLESSSYNILTNNICKSNRSDGSIDVGNGIWLGNSSDHNIIENNVCGHSYNSGIWLHSSNCNYLAGNICDNYSNNVGIYLYSSDNNTVTGNRCYNDNAQGIKLNNSYYNYVTNNLCENNQGAGIKIQFSWYNHVTGNIIENNGKIGTINDQGFGAGLFVVFGSGNNDVSNNTFSGNLDYDIAQDTTCTGNVFANNTYNTKLSYSNTTTAPETPQFPWWLLAIVASLLVIGMLVFWRSKYAAISG